MNIFMNFENGDGVMAFTEKRNIAPSTLQTWANITVGKCIEAYEVKDEDLQYYIYDPIWLTDKKIEKILKDVGEWRAKQPKTYDEKKPYREKPQN